MEEFSSDGDITTAQTAIQKNFIPVKNWNTCNISPANIYNTVPDNYFSAVVAFLHPLKMQIRKNPYVPNHRSLPREFKTTFVFHVFHTTGEIFTF